MTKLELSPAEEFDILLRSSLRNKSHLYPTGLGLYNVYIRRIFGDLQENTGLKNRNLVFLRIYKEYLAA